MVTRGNVAIYCYNALTAKTWDVTSSEDGKLTSSKTSDTILAKYFSDFANDNGEMKLVEEATVVKSGANTTDYGKNQILVSLADTYFVKTEEGSVDIGIAGFIDAQREPKKDKEEATYRKGTDVVAYVPTEVANIASLQGKKVDIIFGEDNVVTYLVVTDDSLEGSYVTAIDGDEIEIDGEEYELASDVAVAIFGHALNYNSTTKVYENGDTTIAALFGDLADAADDDDDVVYCIDEDEDFVRNIVADITLNGDDEIQTINFKFSVDGFDYVIGEDHLTINEYVVEKISSKNVLTVSTGVSAHRDIDDYEDDEPRVIKDGEVAEVADIKVGDVVTEVIFDGDLELMIVVSNTVEGTLEDLYKNAFEIDGTEYKVVATPYYNNEGDIEKLDAAEDGVEALYDAYFEDGDEVVTAYLNMAGEVVAVIAEPEATGAVLGVVMSVEEEYDDDNEVTYYEVKILAEDGTNKKYSIYKNSKKNKDLNSSPVAVNEVVIFEANSDRVIIEEDIEVVSASENEEDTYDVSASKDLYVVVDADLDVTVEPNKTLNTYRFTSSTVVINAAEKDIISWDALIKEDDFVTMGKADINTEDGIEAEDIPDGDEEDYTEIDGLYYETADIIAGLDADTTSAYLFTKDGTKVAYVVVWVEEFFYGVSDTQYGILLDVDDEKDENDDRVWFATLLVDGKEVKYECSSSLRSLKGSFVSFDVSDGEIDTCEELVDDSIIAYLSDLTGDTVDADVVDHTSIIEDTTLALDAITVKEVDEDEDRAYITFEAASELYGAEAKTIDLAEDYIIYDLNDAEVIDEIPDNAYVLVVDTNEDTTDGYEIVIVL